MLAKLIERIKTSLCRDKCDHSPTITGAGFTVCRKCNTMF